MGRVGYPICEVGEWSTLKGKAVLFFAPPIMTDPQTLELSYKPVKGEAVYTLMGRYEFEAEPS